MEVKLPEVAEHIDVTPENAPNKIQESCTCGKENFDDNTPTRYTD
jgi:hypothetical protein